MKKNPVIYLSLHRPVSTGEREAIKRREQVFKKYMADVKGILNQENKGRPVKFDIYRERSEKKGVPFLLTEYQFSDLMQDNCHYCGEPGGTIDRIKPELGYTVNNCVPSCYHCNMMKWTGTYEEFIRKVHLVAAKHPLP